MTATDLKYQTIYRSFKRSIHTSRIYLSRPIKILAQKSINCSQTTSQLVKNEVSQGSNSRHQKIRRYYYMLFNIFSEYHKTENHMIQKHQGSSPFAFILQYRSKGSLF